MRKNFLLFIFCVIASAYCNTVQKKFALNVNTTAHTTDFNEIKPTTSNFCKITTYCAWSSFNPQTMEVDRYALNPTCVCAPGQKCKAAVTNLGSFIRYHQCIYVDQL